LLALTASARRSVQPVSRAQASSPWSTLPAGTPRRRSPVPSRRCPPIRFRRPGSGCPAVRCPVTWGRRPAGPAVGRLLSTRPVSSRLVSAPVRPDASVSSHLRRWPGDRDHRNRWRPCGCRAVDGSTTVQEAGTRATLPKSRWSMGGSVADPGRRVGCGPRRPRLTTERPGRPGRRAERPSRAAARWAREQGCSARWRQPPRGCRPRLGARPRCVVAAEPGRSGGRPRRGHWRWRRGWACGPSAAQAGSQRSWLGAGSALSCDDWWWACQDLNLGPHPYQVSRAKRCADRRFPRSLLSVEGEGMRS
jgi:hypothetical protein